MARPVVTEDKSTGSSAASFPSDPVIHGESAQLDIKPPPRLAGKLIATPDSFNPNLVLNIYKSRTSWGRLATNGIVYENIKDTRVPKVAFYIFFFSSEEGLEENVDKLSQQGKDWTSLPNLHVGVFPCATSGIAVNGKHFKQKDEKDRAQYGLLHTGDIIQVFHNPRTGERLKFKCEFYLGTGRETRAEGESFAVLQGTKLPG